MIASTEVTTVANEAVDQLQVAREYMAWLDSLAWAINCSLKLNQGHHAKQLAGVVSYLAGDYHNMLDSEVKSLTDRLETLAQRT